MSGELRAYCIICLQVIRQKKPDGILFLLKIPTLLDVPSTRPLVACTGVKIVCMGVRVNCMGVKMACMGVNMANILKLAHI